MGPRLGSRGNVTRVAGVGKSTLASMGPRLGSRGNTGTIVIAEYKSPLQWGRGWVAAETEWALKHSDPPWCFNGAAAG